MKFRNKTILIVSQQDWGKMFISKHHYAVALSRLGNKVFFLNSPTRSTELKRGEVRVEQTDFDNVFEVKHKFFYPYIVKYKAKRLHYFLQKLHLQKVFIKVGEKVDIVWSFDLSDTVSLKSFPNNCLKIFMPVDEPSTGMGIDAGAHADVMFSVTNEILDKYKKYDVPKLFINHGVSSLFFKHDNYKPNENIQVGLSGNFLRSDIDWATLVQIIKAHPEVTFNFWGATSAEKSNLAGAIHKGNQPDLFVFANVKMHGILKPELLADALYDMDAFIICYDISKDHSGGTNYHKVLEYMATGRVIVSNNITTYANTKGLVEMPQERNNSKLPELFTNVINNIADYNSDEKRLERVKYASSHTYEGNIARIEEFVTEKIK